MSTSSWRPGELLAIMGPSGCGKSTLLNMIGALDQPTEGEVWVGRRESGQAEERRQLSGPDGRFCLPASQPAAHARPRVENVEVPMYGQAHGAKQRRERAEHLLSLVGLAERADHLPSQLSGGQRQRIAVARALANDPALILADEPTGSLDSQSGEEILELLAELNTTQGTTIAIVTHDRRVAQSTQRVVRMRDGRIVADHRLLDPMEEDLRTLANSRLGQAILDPDDEPLAQITPEEELVLRRILERIDGPAKAVGEATTGD